MDSTIKLTSGKEEIENKNIEEIIKEISKEFQKFNVLTHGKAINTHYIGTYFSYVFTMHDKMSKEEILGYHKKITEINIITEEKFIELSYFLKNIDKSKTNLLDPEVIINEIISGNYLGLDDLSYPDKVNKIMENKKIA